MKLGDKETGLSNVFQILQDLRHEQHSSNFEPKPYETSTTFMTGTIQPKSHEKPAKIPQLRLILIICLCLKI